jgi:ClpP class serine protease
MMNHPKILAEIERTQWAITDEALRGILLAVEKELTAEDYKLFHQLDETKRDALVSDLGERMADTKNAHKQGKTGILFIDGPIIPRGSALTDASGLTSIEALTRDFHALEADNGIHHIMLLIDSPGGSVTGISDFTKMVKMSSKLTTSFVFGQALSAAYWIATGADRIVSVDTGLVGSIGVIITHRDKAAGEDNIEFISSQSPQKKPDVSTDEGRASLQRIADDLGDVFISAVAENRDVDKKNVIENFGQGAAVVARRALDAGMIDEIQSLDSIMTGINFDISAQAQPRRRDGSQVQTLIFDKKVFPTRQSATRWAREHDFRADKVDETENSWRLRQREPGDFVRFRTIRMTRGVQAVIGPLKTGRRAENDTNTPAIAGNHKEGSKMPETLKEVLAEYPAIAAEYERAIEAAKAEGFEAGKTDMQARVEAVTPYLKKDSVYGEAVFNLALQVLAGRADAIALSTFTSVLDAQKEARNAEAAAKETEEQDETPPQPPEAAGDSSQTDEAKFRAAVDADRKRRGLEARYNTEVQ